MSIHTKNYSSRSLRLWGALLLFEYFLHSFLLLVDEVEEAVDGFRAARDRHLVSFLPLKANELADRLKKEYQEGGNGDNPTNHEQSPETVQMQLIWLRTFCSIDVAVFQAEPFLVNLLEITVLCQF